MAGRDVPLHQGFPWAIEHGANHAPPGKLKDVLLKQRQPGEEPRGVRGQDPREHGGLSSAKRCWSSSPLVSTRAVSLLMREMFAEEPISVLLMAALVEAQEFPEDRFQVFRERMRGLRPPAHHLRSILRHQKVDVGMGHAELFWTTWSCFDIRRSGQRLDPDGHTDRPRSAAHLRAAELPRSKRTTRTSRGNTSRVSRCRSLPRRGALRKWGASRRRAPA